MQIFVGTSHVIGCTIIKKPWGETLEDLPLSSKNERTKSNIRGISSRCKTSRLDAPIMEEPTNNV